MGDQINIVNAGGTPTIGTLQTGAGSTEGSFSVDENYDLTGPYKAVYPSSGTFNVNTLTLVLPETQNLAGASAIFANGANPMVAVSANGTSDWTEVQSWTMTAKGASGNKGIGRDGITRGQGNWYQYSVDLSAYAGLKYVAIRHFNWSDMFVLNVDDIELSVNR